MKRRCVQTILCLLLALMLLPMQAFAEPADQTQTAGHSIAIDETALVDGYGILENGTAYSAIKFAGTDFVDCTGVESIRLSVVQTYTERKWGLAFYDANRQLVSFEEQMNGDSQFLSVEKTVAVPEKAVYFRTTYYNSEYRTATGNAFSCILYYRPGYESGQTPEASTGVRVTLGEDELADYYGIREDGTTFSAVKFGCTSYIDCTGVASIRLTMVDTKTSYHWGLAFYDVNKQFIYFVEQGNTAADLQSIEKTVFVPADAKYFRTTYYNFENRKATGHTFSCVLNYKADYRPDQYRPYQKGHIYFSREVNQSLPAEIPEYKRTTGVLALPESYTPTGEKTKLILYFHGYSHGVYMDHWGTTATFLQQKEHFLERGYAVMDCNGARDNNKMAQNTNSSAASRQYVDGFWQCYQYAIQNYNLDPQVYVVGGSAGGPPAINFTDWHSDNVEALLLLSPWTDLKAQSWGQGIREPFVEYLGFENTTTYETEKTLEVDPALRIKIREDGAEYIDSIKVPVRAFMGANETGGSIGTLLVRFMNALRVFQPNAELVIWEGRGHEIVSGAVLEVDNAVCDFFDAIGCNEHTIATIPAVAPTCTTTGLTEGKHCAVCSKVIVAQTELPALGHSFTDDRDATCDNPGCTYVRELPYIPGDINGDGKTNNRDAVLLLQYLSDWEVSVVEAALDVNGDGKVNNRDAVLLLQYLSDWDVEIY